VQYFDSNADRRLDARDEYVDIWDFAFLVQTAIDDPGVDQAAQTLMDAVDGYILYNRNASGTVGSNFWDHANAHGVSIFFPKRPRSFYNAANFTFLRDSQSATAGRGTLSEVNWNAFLDTFVAAAYPDATDDPNPPPLVPRLDISEIPDGPAQQQIHLPLIYN
jgi:hypothetical protein